MNLKPASLKALTEMGFENPTEIQSKAVPLLIEKDTDFIGQAQTGTGKTAAFVLPLLQKIDRKSDEIQALILAPTRELANQIQEEINKIAKYEYIPSLAVYGGASVVQQLRSLKRDRPRIVVGTPGRVMDFIDRGALNLDHCKVVILDEADEMLDMGFFDDVLTILEAVKSEQKNIWMFSATMPGPILNLIKEHFNEPEVVKVKKQNLTADSVEQEFVVVRGEHQVEALARILDFEPDMYAIIFCRTKVGVDELCSELNYNGYPTEALHGDMSQDQRDNTMKRFKEKRSRFLICTDVAARGIDVSDLTHVINFSLPQDNESYVHRIGRTGRGGKKGKTLAIITPSELRRITMIERMTGAKINRISLPTVADIQKSILERHFNNFQKMIEAATTAKTFSIESDLFKKFKERFSELSSEDLLKGLFSSLVDDSFTRYENARDIDVKAITKKPMERGQRSDRNSRFDDNRGNRQSPYGERGDRADRGDRRPGGPSREPGMARFFINIGREEGVGPGELIRFLCRSFSLKGEQIGRIDLKDRFSFFEVPEQFSDKLLGPKGHYFNEKQVSIEAAQGGAGGSGRDGGGRGYSPRQSHDQGGDYSRKRSFGPRGK